MSNRTDNGSIIVHAGPHVSELPDGRWVAADQPLGREMLEVLFAVMDREGVTPDDVTAIEFNGEGRPIIHRPPGRRAGPFVIGENSPEKLTVADA